MADFDIVITMSDGDALHTIMMDPILTANVMADPQAIKNTCSLIVVQIASTDQHSHSAAAGI